MPIFGKIWPFFGQKFYFFREGVKVYVPTYQKTSFALFFGWAWDQMGQKKQKLAKNANFGPNLAVIGPKKHFLGGGSKTFGTLISGNQSDTSYVLKTVIGEAPIGRYGQKCAILTPNLNLDKGQLLFWNDNFCQLGNSPNSFFSKKKCLKTDIYLGKGYFFFAQLCPVVARTWCPLRSVCFLGPKIHNNQILVFCPKILFCF